MSKFSLSHIFRFTLTLLLFGALTAQASDERALLVPVEAGIHRVQVEIWDADQGEWVVYSVAHLDGTAGTVKVRIPADCPSEHIRVHATARALVPTDWIDDDSTITSRRMFESDGAASRATPDGPGFTADGVAEGTNDDLVVESDIWKVSGDALYFFNQRRGLQVFDIADPSNPVLTGTLRYPARGEQMYQIDADHVLLLARGQENMQAEIVRLHDGAPYITETLRGLPGYYVESRLIGSRFYIATQSGRYETTGDGESGSWVNTLHVNGFDLTDPANPVALGELVITLGRGWGYVLTATNDTLILSANQYIYEEEATDWWSRGWHYESVVHLIDLTAEDGVPYVKASTPLAGRTIDKFKLRLRGNVLTAITQAQGYRVVTEEVEIPNPDFEPEPIETPDGEVIIPPPPDDVPPTIIVTRTRREWYRNSVLENFALEGDTLSPIGKVELAKDENLRATRFADDRVYIVTFEQIDPLFAVDLSDPADPTILGELEIPGWSTYLQVLENDQLFSIGVETGRVALSLFDVADGANMSLLNRVYLSEEGEYSWSEGNYDEKAISVFPDQGLALVPYQSYNYKDGWSGYTKALQVVEIAEDKLILRGTLESGDQVRRASLLGEENIISVSNEELVTASIADPDAPVVLASLPLSWSVDELFVVGDHLLQVARNDVNNYWYWGYREDVAEDPPILRISPRDEPDELLATIDLMPGNLRGLTVHAGTLYTLYLDFNYDSVDDEAPAPAYRLETYDVSDPVAPTHRGTAEIDFPLPRYYWGQAQLQPAWMADGTLVWMPSAQTTNHWWAWDWWGFGPRGGLIDCCWLPMGASEAHLLVADVTNADAPRFTGATNLTREDDQGSTAYSEAFLIGRKVLLTESYHWWERIEEEDPDKPDGYGFRYENHVENNLLSIAVDDDGGLLEPFVTEIPGTLTGAIPLEDGALLALTRERELVPASSEDERDRQQTLLHAFLFDGSQILPIDRIALGADNAYDDSQLAFAFADRVIYRAGHDYAPELDRLSAVQRIQFADTGEFAQLDALPVPNVSQHDLDAIDGHLLNRNAEATTLWQIDGPNAVEVGVFDPPSTATWWGWVWNQPGAPAVVPDVGLWIPAATYGVDFFALPSSSDAADTAMAFAERRLATHWDPVPTSAWSETTLAEADTVGPMEELRWRFKAADFVALDEDALDFGDYWYESAWYGWYHQRGNAQWLYHLTHGWQFVTKNGNGVWIYDGQLGWCWTQDATYPYLYSAQRNSWLFFLKGSDTGTTRWFYDFSQVEDGWFSVEPS